MITAVWHSVCVILLIAAALGTGLERHGIWWRGWQRMLVLALLAALIAVAPIAGFSVARWVATATASFSIPLVAVIMHRAWESATGAKMLDGRALEGAWLFGMGAGLALYPMALGVGQFDPYELGWQSSPVFVLVLVVTVAFLLCRNRFGVVLIGSILAYDLRLLESSNLWDYLIDPLFVALATLTLAARGLKRIKPCFPSIRLIL